MHGTLWQTGMAAVCIGACAADAGAPPHFETRGAVKMIRVAGGEFTMGSDRGAAAESPAHRVQVDGFHMDQTPVTQAEYERLMGNNPARAKGPRNPVETVRWSDAARYCNARSKEEGLEPCYDPADWRCDFGRNGFRLPTEAEWEYACRAGTASEFFCGDNDTLLQIHAWYKRNSGGRPRPVGMKRPNPWGLADMTGNVFEWCNDFFDPTGYKPALETNPKGPAAGQFKVLRGGCYKSDPGECRSAARAKDRPAFTDVCLGYETYGFRCVRRLTE